MSDSDDRPFTIKKQPVLARDESGAKLFGWTMEEFAAVGAGTLFALFFVPIGYLKLATIIVVWIWVKHLKKQFPEKYLSNMWRYHTRSDLFLRASQKDLEWRPPTQ